MNSRERVLAMLVVAAVLIVGGAFVFYQLFWGPMNAREVSIQNALEDIDKKKRELEQADLDHAKVERLKQLSLPGDANTARREYETYLRGLLVKSGFSAASVDITVRPANPGGPQLPNRKPAVPIYTTLDFAVDVKGKLESLVNMMKGFYGTGLLHSIKTFSVDLPPVRDLEQQRAGDLTIKMTIEALIVNGVDHRPYLLPNIDRRLVAIDAWTALRGGPGGLAWGLWAASPSGPKGPAMLATKPRDYTAIAAKNIFLGLPQKDRREIIQTAKFVYLTHIILGDRYHEAYFSDRFNDSEHWLRNQRGYDQTTISDSSADTRITLKAVQIDARDVIFSVGDKYYSIHIGQNLAEAMSDDIPKNQVDALIKDRVAASTKN